VTIRNGLGDPFLFEVLLIQTHHRLVEKFFRLTIIRNQTIRWKNDELSAKNNETLD